MTKRVTIYRNDKTEIELTSEQIKVLNSTANTIIEGVAGSGKTLLAILLAERLIKEGRSVAIVVYTKALSKFLNQKINLSSIDLLIDYEYQWNQTYKKYDYIIVDEFQDFSLETLYEIKKRSIFGVYFFGDLKQKLYYSEIGNNRETINEKGLRTLNFKRIYLTNNFRVPNSVVNLLNDLYYKLANPNKIKVEGLILNIDSIYEEKKLPLGSNKNNLKVEVCRFESHINEIEFISNIVNKFRGKSIGILMDMNEGKNRKYSPATSLFGALDQNTDEVPSIEELANNISNATERNIGYKMNFYSNLEFSSNDNVNILTIHSAKGLEFDIVILPFLKADQGFIHPNSMYVAMTRCKEQLILTYSGYINVGLEELDSNMISGTIKSLNI